MNKSKFYLVILLILLLLLLAGCASTSENNDDATSPTGPPPMGDYGDAPDGDVTGYPDEFAQEGDFPTLFSSDGARVLDVNQAWLGESASAELDANDPADPDGTPNLTNADSDDGLVNFFISLIAIPPPTEMTVNVSAPEGSSGGTFYLNAIIDLNMDGEWGGQGINGELEWVVQNQPVQVVPGEIIPFTPPAFAFSNGNLLPDGAYMRLALTKETVPNNWNGTGEFSAGEIEDHFIKLPEFDDDEEGGKVDPPPILSVNCGGPYKPGQKVTCVVTNLRPIAGTFTFALRHLGPGGVGVPIANCNPAPPGGPLPIGPNGVINITCDSVPGKAPDNWQLITKVVDPMAVLVPGGIRLGHTETSISTFAFEGEPKALNVFAGRAKGFYTHFVGVSCLFAEISVFGNDPIPMADATVSVRMTRPDGSTETLSAITGLDGKVLLEFDIYVYGDYKLDIVNIEGENMIYSPEMNVATSLDVLVEGKDSIPVGPEGIPDPEISFNVRSFVEKFNTAFILEDVDTLHSLLHPAVFERYGLEACYSYVESVIGNTVQVEIVEVLAFGWWDWEMDEFVSSLDNVFSVLVNAGLLNQSSQQEIHYGQVEDGSLRWFTDCGDPLN